MNIIKDTVFSLTCGTTTNVDDESRCLWVCLDADALCVVVVLHTTQVTVAANLGGWLLDLAMGFPWERASDEPHPVIKGCRRVAWGFWSVTWGWVGLRGEAR